MTVRNIAIPTAYQNNRSESFQLNLASLECLKCVRHTLSIKVAKKSPPFSYSLPMSSLDTRRKLPGILLEHDKPVKEVVCFWS